MLFARADDAAHAGEFRRDNRLSLRSLETDRSPSLRTRVGRQPELQIHHHRTAEHLFVPRVAALGSAHAPHGRAAHNLTDRSIRSRSSRNLSSRLESLYTPLIAKFAKQPCRDMIRTSKSVHWVCGFIRYQLSRTDKTQFRDPIVRPPRARRRSPCNSNSGMSAASTAAARRARPWVRQSETLSWPEPRRPPRRSPSSNKHDGEMLESSN
jgi:hypothetical protein